MSLASAIASSSSFARMIADDRTEALVAKELHRRRDLVDARGGHQHAVRLAAGHDAVAPLRDRVVDQALTCSTVFASTTAPSGVLPSRGSPTGMRADLGRELLDERIGDRLDDDDPLGRHADLALVHEGAEGRGLHRLVEVGVLEHDQRRLAAEFEQHRLQVLGRALGDDPADRGRAGEVDPLAPPDGRSARRRPRRHPRARW